jgi:signal transduction histidine kinase
MPPPFHLSSLRQWRRRGWRRLARPAPLAAPGEPPQPWALRHAVVLAAALALLLSVLAAAFVLDQPWLGLRLQERNGSVLVAAVVPGSPAAAAAVPAGVQLVALESGDGQRLALQPGDLVEHPGLLHAYADGRRFYQRQDQAMALLRTSSLALRLRASSGREWLHWVRPAAARPLASLPLAFWWPWLVAVLGTVAAGWVLAAHVVRPAVWFGALATLMLPCLVLAAAVVGARELALPAALTHALTVVQHSASLLALWGMAGVLAYFPQRLGPSGRWAWPAGLGLCLAAVVADSRWWLPSPNWAYRAMAVGACIALAALLWRQWRASATQPQARATLRAVTVPWALGLGGLIGLQELPLLLGLQPPLAQSWLLGFTLLLSVGTAIALRGLRAFELGDWALQQLLIWGAGVAVLAIYQVIQAQRWVNEAWAMLAVLLVFGLAYVPAATWAWHRLATRQGPSPRELTSGILVLGLSALGDRSYYWADLLRQTFHARHVEWGARSGAAGTDSVAVVSGGKALSIPPVASLPGMMLWDKNRGAQLFSRSDRWLAERLLELARRTIEARDAYGRGAAEERERIADDLHDDLGAKLLSLVHASSPQGAGREVATLAREALDEMRLAVRNLKAKPSPLNELLADWRAENVARLRAALIAVDWDARAADEAQLIPARVSLHMTRVLREAVTNVIRHSGATRCQVRVAVAQGELYLHVEDNGRGLDASGARSSAGLGLANIERRARRLGGAHRYSAARGGGLAVTVRVPLGLVGPDWRQVSRL